MHDKLRDEMAFLSDAYRKQSYVEDADDRYRRFFICVTFTPSRLYSVALT
jgi:hypothetical protein